MVTVLAEAQAAVAATLRLRTVRNSTAERAHSWPVRPNSCVDEPLALWQDKELNSYERQKLQDAPVQVVACGQPARNAVLDGLSHR